MMVKRLDEILIETLGSSDCLPDTCQSRTERNHFQTADPTNKRRIVLVGKTGSGKSATGNNILGRDVFVSRGSPESVTSKCQMETSPEKKVAIIDTPGIFDTNITDDGLVGRISECVVLCPEGFHAIVVVLSVASGGRFTKVEMHAVQVINGIFGKGAGRHMIVLFTGIDQLTDITIEDYIKESNDLWELVKECGERYCTFNNRATGAVRQQQVSQFLAMIDKMADENGSACYTNEMFEEARKLVQKVEDLETVLNKQLPRGARSMATESSDNECTQLPPERHAHSGLFKKLRNILFCHVNQSTEGVRSISQIVVSTVCQYLNGGERPRVFDNITKAVGNIWQTVKEFIKLMQKIVTAVMNGCCVRSLLN